MAITLNGTEVKRCLVRTLQDKMKDGKVRSINVARHMDGQFNKLHKPFRKVRSVENYGNVYYINVSDGRGGERSIRLTDSQYVYYR